jgi:hypothetical protein
METYLSFTGSKMEDQTLGVVDKKGSGSIIVFIDDCQYYRNDKEFQYLMENSRNFNPVIMEPTLQEFLIPDEASEEDRKMFHHVNVLIRVYNNTRGKFPHHALAIASSLVRKYIVQTKFE